MWWLYELLFLIGFILYLPKALWRRRLPHAGWTMRLGRYPDAVTARLGARPSIWVHAVSVGEVLAAKPLLKALAQAHPDTPLALSTITPGGFHVASKELNGRHVVVFLPLDLQLCVRRALDALRPKALFLMESELWPVLIRLTHAAGVPVAVVNGRISPRAFGRYRLVRPWLPGLWRRVSLFLMQSQADADRLLALGAPPERVRVVGSLKWDASLGSRPVPQQVREVAGRLGLTAAAPVLVAGSTHRGEEDAVLGAFRALRSHHPQARLIVAPRHLERLGEVEGLIRGAGFAGRRLSEPGTAAPWDVGLVDTFGQLPLYYALATAAFIGGSLIPHGGQNPLEATSLGRPVVFGPHMHNFEAIAHQLLAHHAARQAADGAELTEILQELLSRPEDAQAMGQRSQELTERFQGATQRTLELLAPLLVQ